VTYYENDDQTQKGSLKVIKTKGLVSDTLQDDENLRVLSERLQKKSIFDRIHKH